MCSEEESVANFSQMGSCIQFGIPNDSPSMCTPWSLLMTRWVLVDQRENAPCISIGIHPFVYGRLEGTHTISLWILYVLM